MPTVLSLRKISEGYAVRSSSYVIVLMLLLLVCLPKSSFFFFDTSSALAFIVQDLQLIMPTIQQRSSSLRIWAEPEDATEREQGHDG